MPDIAYIQYFFHKDYDIEVITEKMSTGENIVLPKDCIGYRTFIRTEVKKGNNPTLYGEKREVSPITYLGKLWTYEQIKKHRDLPTLVENMEKAQWEHAVETVTGGWLIPEPGSHIAESEISHRV